MQLLPSTIEHPREIGRGSHGIVYRGIWNNRTIAIKCISKYNHSKEMWKQEIDMMRRLECVEGVPTFLDAAETDDSYCILMQHIRGSNGAAIVNDAWNGSFVPEETLRIWARDLLYILAACHDRGIVFNDLKPANMLVTCYQASLVDLGSCRMHSYTKGKPIGTPFYFAPEKFDGHNDYESDIWSFGVAMYALASGAHPFVKNVDIPSTKKLKEKILTESLSFPSEPWLEYSPEFKDLLSRMLRKDKTRRLELDAIMCHPWLII